MPPRTFGTLATHLRLPAGWTPAGGLVVLLHGFGAPGDDLVALADYLGAPPTVGFAFPEAPLTLGGLYGDSRAWWMIDLATFERGVSSDPFANRGRTLPEGLAPARAAVEGALAAMQAELGVADDRVILGGFSQGSMLALDVILRSSGAFAGAALMSTTFLAETEWTPLMPARAGLPVILSHGRSDGILPFAVSERLYGVLKQAGLDVTWVPFTGAHAIPPAVLQAVGALVRARLG